jgi:DNA-binding MarR family transcriptional regulator
VSRVRSESDRRTVLVGITPAGVQLLAEMHEPLRACHEQQLGHLPPEALRQLIELLRQVRDPHEPRESSWH